MTRKFVLASAVCMISACSSRVQTNNILGDGGSAGTSGDAGAGGSNAGGPSAGGSSAGGAAGKGSSGGAASSSGGGTAGSGEAGMAGEDGSGDDCPASGCPRSCDGLADDCGPNQDQNCCASIVVPAASFAMGRGTSGPDAFAGGDDDELPEHTASVLELRIDTFEVTLGRFAKFMAAAPGSFPAEGDGAHPGIAGSGWQTAWNDQLDGLTSTLQCGFMSTWTDPPDPSTDRALPMNCLSYYAAFAFCAWDGGFLPSEADWEAIAAGGAENRLYPWGSAAPDASRTNFNCGFDGSPVCDFTDIPRAGTFPTGRGRYGHYDLGGSMEEWVLDAFVSGWYAAEGATCTNCASLPQGDLDAGDPRILRGGSWNHAPEGQRAAARRVVDARELFTSADFSYGVRCARSP
jgi:sulfatase modifying factor 1